jgi:hypothetical protein
LRRPLTTLDLFAYAVAAAFTIIGLVALAGGDASIGPTKMTRQTVHMGGVDRHVFGSLLLATGYVLWRWVFRLSGEERRLSVELRIVALFALLGCIAYLVGG